MTNDAALQALTQIVFVAIFLITVGNFARRRTRDRAEIALLFGTLAVIIVLQGITQLTGLQIPQASLIAELLLLAQPYLQLRLVGQFRKVPAFQHAIGIVALAASWGAAIWMLASNNTTSSEATLVVVIAFGYVEGYASLAFIRAAVVSRGVTQRRLIAVAIGAGLLAAVILLAGVTAYARGQEALKILSDVLGLASAISYYIGFTPPRWLRRSWQISEFQEFLSGLIGRSAEERFSEALDRVGPAVARSLGAKTALVALGSENGAKLTIRPDAENRELLLRAGVETLSIAADPLLARVASTRVNGVSNQPGHWSPELRRLAGAAGGAGSLLAAPLMAHGTFFGVLLVLFEQRSLFLMAHGTFFGVLLALFEQRSLSFESQLLLASFAEQAALAISGAQLVGQLQEQNSALESASRMKSEFLANMSHELRTPLNAIIGFSELLVDAQEGDLDEETERTYLERIHDSGRHLLELINDILDLSKIEAGRMELHAETFDVRELVQHVLSTVQPLADRKRIHISAATGEAGQIYADPGKLKQILYNLLSNAIKFTPEEGAVAVEAQREPGELHLVVSDTGIGIAPEDQERIFVEFLQVDSGVNRKHEGTGLGLALTKRFVEMHDGRLWIESEPGAGSRFHIAIPLFQAPAEPAPRPVTPAAAAADGPLVLVVEDNPSAAHLMTIHLARGGYQARVVGDGREALALAREVRPAAITLDVMLPGLDGWEVLRELKADPETRDIPVIVASIVDNQPLGYALGATDYLVNPIDRELLLAHMARYVVAAPGKDRAPTILIVDDDPGARELLSGVLTPMRFTVEQASSGSEALDRIREQPPDAVLLDLMMPGMSGFDVVVQMRLDPNARHIPVFIVTAKDLTQDERSMLNGSIAGIFNKGSLSKNDLVDTIEQVVAAHGQTRLELGSAAH
jgi:signal transduction histidine kinase/DNA-binding response OmpR family regulator